MGKTISSFFWRLAERCGAQGVSFIVTILIARLVTPTEYGTVALATVYANVLQVFVDSGMGSALIQKKDSNDVDFSTVFYFNVFMSFLVYFIVFFTAPLVASFYKQPIITKYIRVFSVNILISGVKNIQQAYVSKHLIFKKFFFATLGGTVVSGFVGLLLAYKGFGCWALIAQILTNSLVDTIILWVIVPWRPTYAFEMKRLRGFVSFGWKLLASSLIDSVYNNYTSVLIGKIYSSESLAFYNKGNTFPSLLVQNINSSLDSVLLPTMAQDQDNKTRLKELVQTSICVSTYLLAPMLVGLLVVSDSLIPVLLTEKWDPCIIFVKVFCLYYLIYPIHTSNLNAINALGRSDIFLKIEMIKKIVGIVIIFVSMKHGTLAVAFGMLLSGLLSQIINASPNSKLIDYGYLKQIKDVLPNILMSAVMGIVVSQIKLLNFSYIPTLLLQIIIGVIIYFMVSIIFKPFGYRYLLTTIKRIHIKPT